MARCQFQLRLTSEENEKSAQYFNLFSAEKRFFVEG
jgi:hypothetical protein